MMTNKGGSIVRIDTDVLTAARVLAASSEMSLCELISAAVRFALESAEVRTTVKTVEVRELVFRAKEMTNA